jgi:molybdopterin converting factor small subunit
MKIKLLLFGISSDIVGSSSTEIDVSQNCTVKGLKEELLFTYPGLINIHSYAIAINEAYASDAISIQENDILAIIPPVSGG